MKKKIIIGLIVVVILVLLVPIPMKLKDGGSIEYRAILYSVTKYHQMMPLEATEIDGEYDGYLDGTKIKILGMEVYNSKEEYKSTEKEENTNVLNNSQTDNSEQKGDSKVKLHYDNIENIAIFDKFMDDIDKYKTPYVSTEIQFVMYTIEGDEILITLKYNSDTDEFTLTKDYTQDKYGNGGVTTDTYSNEKYDVVKRIRDEYIELVLVPDEAFAQENLETISVCSYRKVSEQQKDSTRSKVDSVSFVDNNVAKDKLVMYNNILYAKAPGIIDYAKNPNGPVGTINKLIGEEYLPTINGETNSDELLNAIVDSVNEKNMVLQYNNEYVLYEAVETK